MTETDQDRKLASEGTSTSRPEPIIKREPRGKPRETALMPSVSSKISVKVREGEEPEQLTCLFVVCLFVFVCVCVRVN